MSNPLPPSSGDNGAHVHLVQLLVHELFNETCCSCRHHGQPHWLQLTTSHYVFVHELLVKICCFLRHHGINPELIPRVLICSKVFILCEVLWSAPLALSLWPHHFSFWRLFAWLQKGVFSFHFGANIVDQPSIDPPAPGTKLAPQSSILLCAQHTPFWN